MYTKWNVVTAKPFPSTVGNKEEEAYFGMAKTFCAREIAEKSWLLRSDFPKAPGADLAQGQIFLAKSKEKGCFVGFNTIKLLFLIELKGALVKEEQGLHV